MKKSKMIIINILFSVFIINNSIKAQVDTLEFVIKKNVIGVTGSYGSGLFKADLRYGHFVSNRLNIGLNIGKGFRKSYHNTNPFNFGPNIRYYIKNNKVSPFLSYKSNLDFININLDSVSIAEQRIYNFEDGRNISWVNIIGIGLEIYAYEQKISMDGLLGIGNYLLQKKIHRMFEIEFRINFHF